MVQLALAFVALTLASVHASPILEKRIAQVIIDAVEPWENACVKFTVLLFRPFSDVFLAE